MDKPDIGEFEALLFSSLFTNSLLTLFLAKWHSSTTTLSGFPKLTFLPAHFTLFQYFPHCLKFRLNMV